MNYRQVTQTFLNVARQYEQDMAEASRYYKSQNFGTRMHSNGLNVDARDFIPMVALMGINGSTKEERAADIHAKMEELAKAFEDPDHKKRDIYLDLIFYLLDDFGSTFDPAAMNMNDPEQVAKLLQSMLIDQTIGVKKNENPEYYNNRYPTPTSRNLVDARDGYRMAVSSTVVTNLYKNDIDINVVLSLPKPYPEEMSEIQALREQYERGRLKKALEANGALPVEKTVDFPILDSMIPNCGKNVADISKYSEADYDQVKHYYISMIANTLLQQGTKKVQGTKEASLDAKEAIYIDGKPLKDFMKERYPKGDPKWARDVFQGVIIGTSILGGKHKVDVVNTYRDDAGEMQYEARTIRIAVTPEQEELYMQQFSWFRRAFLNWSWSPFRIESLQERMDRIANDPRTDERHAGVIANHKERIETRIAKLKEDALQSKQNGVEFMQHKGNYNEAKNQLEATTAQWDKDSVIGILGQQITATYMLDGAELTGACAVIRKAIATTAEDGYEKMALPFAKVVLYTQLCSERSANGGQPGELEQALGTGSNLQENIEKTAQNLAKDPIFENLVFKKIGEENNGKILPNRSKFERMIISGGYNGFWLEYKQNLKELGNQNKQQASSNKVQLENQHQKQQDMQKSLM